MAFLKSEEEQHTNNLTRLIEEFGEDKGDEIRKIYINKRVEIESSDRIKGGYVPLVMYTNVRNILLNRYKEHSLNEYVPR